MMNLMDHLPRQIYGGEEHVEDLQATVQTQVNGARQARDELLRQARPATATWGMDRFEREYGILPDGEKCPEQRLAHWRAKRRGRGTTTKALIESVASSFTNGEIDVREYPDEYRFTIAFTNLLGIPPNLDSLKSVIEELKPAHLGVEYLIRYNIHRFWSQFSHRQAAGYTHAQMRGREVVFNRNRAVGAYTHGRLGERTHGQIRTEEW